VTSPIIPRGGAGATSSDEAPLGAGGLRTLPGRRRGLAQGPGHGPPGGQSLPAEQAGLGAPAAARQRPGGPAGRGPRARRTAMEGGRRPEWREGGAPQLPGRRRANAGGGPAASSGAGGRAKFFSLKELARSGPGVRVWVKG